MPKESQKPENPERNETKPTPGKPSPDAKKAAEDQGKPGMKYVFKIAPVDGKNSIDFEDIADK